MTIVLSINVTPINTSFPLRVYSLNNEIHKIATPTDNSKIIHRVMTKKNNLITYLLHCFKCLKIQIEKVITVRKSLHIFNSNVKTIKPRD